MARTEAQKRAEKKLNDKSSIIYIRLEKDYGEFIKQTAKDLNMTVADLVKNSLNEYFENHHM